ncbi:MAG TPA: SIMPL domain-containing protein [Acidimicrobiia bacterium]|jgi:hypothetical protein
MSKRLPSQLIVVGLVVLATAVAAPVALGATAGAAGAAARSRTITVTGTGEVRGTPDVADLVLGVSGRGGSAAEVMSRITDRAQKVIDALHDAGVADDDIQTADLSVQPVYDDDGKVTGYEASNTVSVHIRDLTKAGTIVDSAAAKVGDDIRVQGITFSIDDDSALLATARAKATKRARAQAEQLASGAEVEVGEVRSITESTSSMPLAYAADAAEKAAGTPVMAGSQTLSIQATVVFAIR